MEISENKNRELSLELELLKKSNQEKEEFELKEGKKSWWKRIFT